MDEAGFAPASLLVFREGSPVALLVSHSSEILKVGWDGESRTRMALKPGNFKRGGCGR